VLASICSLFLLLSLHDTPNSISESYLIYVYLLQTSQSSLSNSPLIPPTKASIHASEIFTLHLPVFICFEWFLPLFYWFCFKWLLCFRLCFTMFFVVCLFLVLTFHSLLCKWLQIVEVHQYLLRIYGYALGNENYEFMVMLCV